MRYITETNSKTEHEIIINWESLVKTMAYFANKHQDEFINIYERGDTQMPEWLMRLCFQVYNEDIHKIDLSWLKR